MQIICQIFAVDRTSFCIMHLLGVNPYIQNCKVWPQETSASL